MDWRRLAMSRVPPSVGQRYGRPAAGAGDPEPLPDQLCDRRANRSPNSCASAISAFRAEEPEEKLTLTATFVRILCARENCAATLASASRFATSPMTAET